MHICSIRGRYVKLLFDWKFAEYCPLWSSSQCVIICSGKSLEPNRSQASIWTKDWQNTCVTRLHWVNWLSLHGGCLMPCCIIAKWPWLYTNTWFACDIFTLLYRYVWCRHRCFYLLDIICLGKMKLLLASLIYFLFTALWFNAEFAALMVRLVLLGLQ